MIENEKTAQFLGSLLEGRFRLEELLGEGGFGAVFKARDIHTGCFYAIKLVYLSDKLSDEQRIRQIQFFNREAGTLARVKHPNIVKVYDSGLADGQIPYLLMEYVKGVRLSQILLDEVQMGYERFGRIFLQICSAVGAIHECGIIHRDLKPDNIIIGEDERCRLVDFGLAKLVHGHGNDAWLRTLTLSGKVQGTIYYMSPEQAQGHKLDERTDIYSLGVMAYEMLTGGVPFRAKSPVAVMMMHMQSPPPAMESRRPDIHPQLQAAVMKALEKSVQMRYSNVAEMSHAIYAAISALLNSF